MIERKIGRNKNIAKKHDTFNLHQKIKEITGTTREYQEETILTNQQNKILLGTRDNLKTCEPYRETLFDDDNTRRESQTSKSEI